MWAFFLFTLSKMHYNKNKYKHPGRSKPQAEGTAGSRRWSSCMREGGKIYEQHELYEDSGKV
jgi:hypothetical protein